jgi:hypothetical protein
MIDIGSVRHRPPRPTPRCDTAYDNAPANHASATEINVLAFQSSAGANLSFEITPQDLFEPSGIQLTIIET